MTSPLVFDALTAVCGFAAIVPVIVWLGCAVVLFRSSRRTGGLMIGASTCALLALVADPGVRRIALMYSRSLEVAGQFDPIVFANVAAPVALALRAACAGLILCALLVRATETRS